MVGYFFGFLIGYILIGIIMGYTTQYLAKCKGYEGGFWWGFFLGIIGLLVVGFRPDIQSQPSSYERPAWAEEKRTWTCLCGAENAYTLNYCTSCRRSRSEGETKICPHCGSKNKPNNKVCYSCNQQLD